MGTTPLPGAGLLAVVAGVLLGTACAGGPPGTDPGVEADLSVVIQDPHASSLAYVIRCASGGSGVEGNAEIDARDACRALARPAVQNRLIRGPSSERVCSQVYGGPQTAMLSGTLDGQAVNTVVTRADGCDIGDWDNLLRDILLPVSGRAR